MKSRIVFMGTPDFAAKSLQALLDQKGNVAAVFTQPDKPKGRGYQLQAPPVKELAQKHQIQVFQPTSLKSEETLNILKTIKPDLIVVVAYGRILPKEVLNLPPLGCINVHGSLLPKYRGAAPIQWAVINGEKETGVTIMYMDEGLDTGDMILKATTPIGEQETSGELFERLSELGANTLLEAIELLENNKAIAQKQEAQEATLAPLLDKTLARLDFQKSAENLHNLVRGLNPWPIAYTIFQGKRLKVFRTSVVKQNCTVEPGRIISNNNFWVSCGENSIIALEEVLLEGGKKMQGSEFVKTRNLEENMKLGE